MKRCLPTRVGLTGVTLCLSLFTATAVLGQSLDGTGVVPTGLLLRQMDGVKRVLMIGAHPDDEDTSLLTAMARGQGAQTAYLALTRGDGGQNLIGPELWEGLGVIRTGELEAARRIDGGRQFFTRAFDFGYSKSADEALAFWDREALLEDVVWVVRTFRPQVIVAVFSGTPRDGHGHHQAAGILAREAFAAAGDAERFPEQLQRGAEAWTPMKLYQTVRRNPTEATGGVDTGWLDPLLGRSLFQLSMLSRSQHRSQDMGAPQPPGPRRALVRFVDGRGGAESGIFEGIDTTLVGVAATLPPERARAVAGYLEAYRSSLAEARDAYGLNPSAVVAPLKHALQSLYAATRSAEAAGADVSIELRDVLAHKTDLATRSLLAAAGVVVDVRSRDDLVTPGQAVQVTVQLWNGGRHTLEGAEPAMRLPEGWTAVPTGSEGSGPGGEVAPGTIARWTYRVTVPEHAKLSRLYYLRQAREGASYRWPDEPDLWGLPRDPPSVYGLVDFQVAGEGEATPVHAAVPWRFVGVDQARGEFYKPVLVLPTLSAHVAPEGLVWPQERRTPGVVTVTVTNHAQSEQSGDVRLIASDDWTVSPASRSFVLAAEGAERTVSFTVTPRGSPAAGEHQLRAVVRAAAGGEFTERVALVDYPHIERAALFTPATARLTVVPVRVTEGLRVGYVMGTGDGGPGAIEQLGAHVELLGPDAVRDGAFGDYDVVVLGVRAYETREDLRVANAQLLDYARGGGTVVVQYNQYQFARGDFAPYPLDIGRPAPRVSDETAAVRMVEPNAPLFTTPNRITAADFEGWAQERGLYFLSEWDANYVPLLEMNDPGEPARRGSMLVAPVGEGLYVYAALSFFRQFPFGVPGAYRLFANLISLNAADWAAYAATRSGGSERD